MIRPYLIMVNLNYPKITAKILKVYPIHQKTKNKIRKVNFGGNLSFGSTKIAINNN